MGVSVNPSLIVGVKVNNIIKYQTEVETYEEHTPKGEKTGKIIKEENTYLIATVKNKVNKTLVNGRLHTDDISELLEVEDYPGKLRFGLFSLTPGDYTLDDFVLGIQILKCDAMVGESDRIPVSTLMVFSEEVKNIIKKTYNIDVTIEVFLDGGCSY
jgi:hypothetical protein